MIADTIKDIRKRNFLNQTQFANKIGVTQGSVSQWEHGLTRPNSEQLRAISLAFNISTDELLEKETTAIPIRRNSLPILGSIACGQRITPDTTPEGYADIPDGIHADFALRCKGDSMEPTLRDGDLVLIRQQPEVEPGQIAAVNINNETTLKHVYPQENGILLVADNPQYRPVFVPIGAGDEILIHGLAVGYTRLFS
jgi:repressor LexA